MKKENQSDFIQSLLEKYSFQELSMIDQAKVLAEMTPEEYEANRATVLAAMTLFANANIHKPKPLIMQSNPPILLAPIPLYQTLIGIAAVALLLLLTLPIQKLESPEPLIKYITQNDTIVQEVIRYDTIRTVVEKPILVEKIIYLPAERATTLAAEAPRLLNVPKSNQNLNFSETAMQNRGVSLREDTLLFNLPKIF